MYRVVAFDFIKSYGAWSANPREVYRSESRAKCLRVEQTLRRKSRLGVASVSVMYFTRHVRGTGRNTKADLRAQERIAAREAMAERFYGVDARLETFGDW